MVIVDTSALIAYFHTEEFGHLAATEAIERSSERLVVPPYVVAETGYMMCSRYGVAAELTALRELTGGAWDLPPFARADLAEAIGVIEKYADQEIGVTHASIVVMAKRYGTRTIATLDRRHFEVLRPLDGGRFTIVP